jgi:hypothetical protein
MKKTRCDHCQGRLGLIRQRWYGQQFCHKLCGVELADIDAARKEAVTFSGEVLRDATGETLWEGQPWQLWVTDQPGGKGKTFLTLSFSAVEGGA